jgi:hypothetical protein
MSNAHAPQDHAHDAHDAPEVDGVDAIVPMMPWLLPLAGGVLMFLLAFIAVTMA